MKVFLMMLAAVCMLSAAANDFTNDTFSTKSGPLTITFVGHGTLMLGWQKLVVHVDPVGRYADYSAVMPKADLILITHEHSDHLDKDAIGHIVKQGTVIVANDAVVRQLGGGSALSNGAVTNIRGIMIEAVPAYNLPGKPITFHPKGRDNGYVLTFDGLRVYIAGDTEDIPEMKALKNIDVAFLPMNQPYTMTPKQVLNALRMIRPKTAYPYHFGNTDTKKLLDIAGGERYTELRIRKMN